jgi:hypothetical protein
MGNKNYDCSSYEPSTFIDTYKEQNYNIGDLKVVYD